MFEDVAELGGTYPDAIARQNPNATIASRGCPGAGTEDASVIKRYQTEGVELLDANSGFEPRTFGRDTYERANGFVWRSCSFDEYDRSRRNSAPAEAYDEQQGLFV